MAHDVFISYCPEDKSVADAICANLEAQKIRCWYAPRNLAPGETWAGAIPRAIELSKIFILVFTDHANASGQVTREVNLAVSFGVTIIPYRLTKSEPSEDMGYYLGPVHWLDAINEKQAKAIRQLALRCRGILSESSEGQMIPEEKTGSPRKWKILIPACAAVIALGIFLAWNRLSPSLRQQEEASIKTEETVTASPEPEFMPIYEDSFSCFPNLNAEVGDTVTFGHYLQETGDEAQPTALVWRVLERDSNSMLLISDRVLEIREFSSTEGDTTWEDSSLRKWLNTEWLNQAFTAAEQACIMESTVTADLNTIDATVNQGTDTTDKVYLLSTAEAERYFKSDRERMLKPTARLKKFLVKREDAAYHSANKTCFWWLRTMGKSNHLTTDVTPTGAVMTHGELSHLVELGVVPVVRVNVYSVITASGLVGSGEEAE